MRLDMVNCKLYEFIQTKLAMRNDVYVLVKLSCNTSPDSKVPGANMEPIWGRQDPDEPHVGPMNFAIWVPFVLGIVLENTYLALHIKLTWLLLPVEYWTCHSLF